MTLLWFVVWLLINTFSSHQPLVFDPVNGWTATLILAIGLDLAAAHAPRVRNSRSAAADPTPRPSDRESSGP
jgi:hypothetical protein